MSKANDQQDQGQFVSGEQFDVIDAQLILQANEENPRLFKSILNSISSYVMLVNCSGTIEFANQSLLKMAGLSSEEVIGCKVWEIFDSADEYFKLKAFFSCTEKSSMMTGCITHWKGRDSQKENVIAWRRQPCRAHVDDIQCRFMIATGWDISEQEALRRKLHYQGQQYKEILNNLPVAVEEIDMSGIVTFSNEAHAQLHGKRPLDIIGMPVWELEIPEKRDDLRCYIHEILRDQPEPVSYLTKMTTADGKTIDLQVDWNYRYDDTGQLMGLVVVLQDVTEHFQTREVLDETQKRYESVFHACPMMITLTLLEDDRLADVNDAVEETLGYTREEVIGRSSGELDVFVDYHDREIFFEEIYRNGRAINFETKFRRKDGQIIEGLLAGEKVLIGDSEYVLSYFIDISERKQAEEALRESEDRYRALFEHVPQAISVTTKEGQVLAHNQQLLNIYGYSDQEFAQLDIQTIYTDHSDRKYILEVLEREGYIRDFEVVHKTKSGARKIILMSVVLIGWGGQESLLSIFNDITERIETQHRLAENQRLLSHISDNSPANIVVYDLVQSKNVYANRRYAAFFGVSLGDANTLDHKIWRDRIHRDDLEHVLEYERERMKQGDNELVQYEFRMKNVSGEYRWLHAWRTVFARDEAGRPTQFLGVTVDVTERKQAEAEREVLIDQLRQSQKLEAIGTLASGVAHDYYNLMMVINSATDYARKTINEDHVAYASFDIIEKACQQAADVTRALRAFSQTGQMVMDDLDLLELMEEAIDLIRRMMPGGIEIETQWETSQPITIEGHRGYLQQVLINLMVNARDAMEGAGVLTVSMDVQSVNVDQQTIALGKAVCISIKDNGCGMSNQVKQRLFEPFFTTKPRGQGTGLGLAVVHGIIHDHGGRIEVESEVGVGTTMKVYLPLIEMQV